MPEKKELCVIDHAEHDGPSAFGREMFLKSLSDQGINVKSINYWTQTDEGCCILIGKTQDRRVQQLLAWNNVKYEVEPEGVFYQWCSNGNGRVLVAAGTDDNGLMYALLELAERIQYDGLAAFGKLENCVEYPENNIRSVSRFVMSQRDDEWFYSEEFWEFYFARLAKYRFNRFVLILGFDTPYMSPPYPFFVDVPGYAHVRAKNLDEGSKQKNLSQLRRIGQLCKNHGFEYTLATWQQQPWTTNQKVMVEGLTQDEQVLAEYCAAGLRELLTECPEIEVLQLRVNHESGIGTEQTADEFWKKLIVAVSEGGTRVKLDLRAKGLTDAMIQFALEQGLQLAVPTKYWCEHVALPYHLTRMREEELQQLDNYNHSRRYSYSDLIRKPHFYDVIYRLWNYGSNTIFLWGDPDFCRRFSYSLNYGQSVGFEITAPLSLKGGQASFEDEPWPLFDDKTLVHYKWEDERYWAYYLFFGRLTYSSKTMAEVWKREFKAHFAEAADFMEAAYRAAGKILPLIATYHMPVHPSLSYWPEVCTGAALFQEHNFNPDYHITFQDSEPSDSGLFYGISEYVQDVLDRKVGCKYTPTQVKNWLSAFAKDVRSSIEAAEMMSDISLNSEFQATKVDMLMQADLAEYHTHKIMAAMELSFYLKTTNPAHLQKAYNHASVSLQCWKVLSERGSAYHDNLQFGVTGVGRSTNWKARLPELEKDVAKLKTMVAETRPDTFGNDCDVPISDQTNVPDRLMSFDSDVPEYWKAGQDLKVTVRVGELCKFQGNLKMHYRHMNQLEGSFLLVEMSIHDGAYEGVISGEYITHEWDLMVYFSAVDFDHNVIIYPGVYHPKYLAPYHVVQVVQ